MNKLQLANKRVVFFRNRLDKRLTWYVSITRAWWTYEICWMFIEFEVLCNWSNNKVGRILSIRMKETTSHGVDGSFVIQKSYVFQRSLSIYWKRTASWVFEDMSKNVHQVSRLLRNRKKLFEKNFKALRTMSKKSFSILDFWS